MKNFVFVGGSALSYYLNHRLSENVDLFSEDELLPKKSIDNFLNKLSKDGLSCKYLFTGNNQIDALVDGVKISFYASGEGFLSKNVKNLNGYLRIASFDIIVYMKAKALSLRGTFRCIKWGF